MKMKLMRKIDLYVGVPLCYLLAVFEKFKKVFFNKNPKEIKKVLIIKFLGIGSITLAQPTLVAVKDKFPDAEILFLTFKSNEGIVDLLNFGDKKYFIDTKNLLEFILSTFKTIFRLRKQKVDIVLDLEFFSKFPLIISSLIGAKQKAGFYLILEPWRKSLLNYHGYYNHYYHTKNIFLSLAYLVKENDPYYLKFDEYVQTYSFPHLTMSDSDKNKMAEKLKKRGWQDQKIILINPNVGPELAPELRKWPKKNFASLIEKIDREYYKVLFILIGSKSEKAYVQEIIDFIPQNNNNNIINFAGETSLKELLCLFELSSLFVSIDSGPMHLASLTNIPIIGLFGTGIPIIDGPKSKNSVALCKNLYCIPMLTVYNGKQTELKESIPVKLITVDEVFNNVKKMLA